MRDILFRGKRSSNGEWVYGAYAKFMGIDLKAYSYIIPVVENECVNFLNESARVRPETVCEYIGITDKNGHKIFEGDIVEYKTTSCGCAESNLVFRCKVVFQCCRFYFKMLPEYQIDCPIPAIIETESTVIGNIYDNPELLEGGDTIATEEERI